MEIKVNKKYLFTLLLFAGSWPIFYFWGIYSGPLLSSGEAGFLLAIGRLCGLLAVYFVLLQVLLISRAKYLEKTFGLDRLAIAHHVNGIFLMVFIAAHPLAVISSYALNGHTTFLKQLTDLIKNNDDILGAVVALAGFVFIVGLSAYFAIRKVTYEAWYYIHLLLYFAILLAFGHQLSLGGDFLSSSVFTIFWYMLYTFTFINLAWYRILVPLLNFRRFGFYVDEVRPETSETVSVYIKAKKLERLNIVPGNFMIFRFLDKKRWMQAHPFSVSAMPGVDIFRVTVKDVGNYTKDLKNLKPGTKVLIEGPYGTFVKGSSEKEKFLLVAAGIGITPIRALAEDLVLSKKDTVVLYSNRTLNQTVFYKELSELQEVSGVPVHFVMTRESSWAGETSRLDGRVIKRLVPDFLEREIYICGPVPMIKSLAFELRSLGVKDRNVHYERFSLA